MFRLFIALNILLLNLYACKGGFESCRLKNVHSGVISNDALYIPLQNDQTLVFSKKAPDANIIKHDPYLRLYLITDKKNFKYPFRINMKLSLGTAGVDYKNVIEGKIVKDQIGLSSFATFSEPLHTPSLLLNSCCAIEGIITPLGIIEKEYIDRFLKIKEVSYADIGIRVHDKDSTVAVINADPFMKNNPFKKGDIVLEINDKKVKSAAAFMRSVLFSKIGSTCKVKIKRGSKISTFDVVAQKRAGGGFLSDTFLEVLGIYFDDDLYVIKIEENAKDYGLKIGDRLLAVNKRDVKNKQDVLELVDNPKNSSNLLFQRDQFQFFVKVN